ncbi:MAG: hypothetical protein NVV73_22835 [Cellvibrionaceae bacterium]|nr:hypothetical protein [Cellvibrionaceae bacterium]
MSVSAFMKYLPLIFGSFLLFFALALPNSLWQIDWPALFVLPLELTVLGLLLFVPGRAGHWLRWLVAILLAARVIFFLADTVSLQVFARPFNPVFDLYLLADALYLLKSTVGVASAWFVAGAAAALAALVVIVAFVVLETIRRPLQPKPAITILLVLGAVGLSLRLAESPHATLRFYQHLALHAHNVQRSLADLHKFRESLVEQSSPTEAESHLLEKLQGKDVLMVFIESYGRTLLDKPEFAPHFQSFLALEQVKLEQSRIGVRSAYLTSPTVGGLSWLAHATAMSGLWIDSQVRYDSLVLSGHKSLNRVFRDAGWRTVAVMPAITMVWPEAVYYGYDHIYHAHNSGYAGKPFNWVTMPDQYTLSAFHRAELEPADRGPVMAEIALISSHAPWTPVPNLVDWKSVADGRIFDDQADSGESPEVVWRDPERIRSQYRLAVEYAMSTLIDYLLTHADDNLVVLAFGDHQPAPLVTGETGNRDVPVHLFTRDSRILDAIADWDWAEGLQPPNTSPVWKMNELRERLVTTMSAPDLPISGGRQSEEILVADDTGATADTLQAEDAPVLQSL